MSSSSTENNSGAEESIVNGNDENTNGHAPKPPVIENGTPIAGARIVELLQEERGGALTPNPLGNVPNRYHILQQTDNQSEDGSLDGLPRRAGSPIDSLLSHPDDSPSIQVSYAPNSQTSLSDILVGLGSVFSWWKQHTTFSCLQTRS